ncbi:MAG: hypothetical protein CM1200mP20_16770 [Pseudomonadota bacterium]|nr:MAG: hypothetical protein CM1200mP20_16770 [Pseudomonadota bacterium]
MGSMHRPPGFTMGRLLVGYRVSDGRLLLSSAAASHRYNRYLRFGFAGPAPHLRVDQRLDRCVVHGSADLGALKVALNATWVNWNCQVQFCGLETVPMPGMYRFRLI